MNLDNSSRSDSNDNEFGIDDFGEFAKQLDSSKEKQEQEKLTQKIQPKEKNPYLNIMEDFILTYHNGLYFNQIKNIIQEKKKSIILDYNHIIGFSDQLSDYLLDNPIDFISNFKDVLNSIDKQQDLQYFDAKKYFNVRLTNYPIREKIKNIDVDQRNKLLCMRGNISKTSDKKPYIWKYYLKCPDCPN